MSEQSPRVPQLAAMLAESGLAAPGDELVGALERTLAPLAASTDAVAPAPSAALLRLLGDPTPGAPQAPPAPTPAPVALPTRVTRTTDAALRPAAPARPTVSTGVRPLLVRGRRALAGALVLAVSGVGATGLSAAAGTLPTSIQRHVSDFSRDHLPFTFPRPGAQTRPEQPLSSTGSVHGSGPRLSRDDHEVGDERGSAPRPAELPGAHLVSATTPRADRTDRTDRAEQDDRDDRGPRTRAAEGDAGPGRTGSSQATGPGRPSTRGPGSQGDQVTQDDRDDRGGKGAKGGKGDQAGQDGTTAGGQGGGGQKAHYSAYSQPAEPEADQPRPQKAQQPRSASSEDGGADARPSGGAGDGRGKDDAQGTRGQGGSDDEGGPTPGGRGLRPSVSLTLPGASVELPSGQDG